jgi:hypothetical protein
MIPPLQPLRLRSIERWLHEQPHQPTNIQERALAIDELMVQAFEDKEDSLKESMMAAKTWGTAEGLTEFPTKRLLLWSETVGQFLR